MAFCWAVYIRSTFSNRKANPKLVKIIGSTYVNARRTGVPNVRYMYRTSRGTFAYQKGRVQKLAKEAQNSINMFFISKY